MTAAPPATRHGVRSRFAVNQARTRSARLLRSPPSWPGASASTRPTMIMALPAPTRRPTSTSMKVAMASPRPTSAVAVTAAKAGLATPMPRSSAPPTAKVTPTMRIACTRSRALNTVNANSAMPRSAVGSHKSLTSRLTFSSVSTAPDCEMLVVTSSTLAGSFLANAGLATSSALRMVTAACCESTSTRCAPPTWNTCRCARYAKS